MIGSSGSGTVMGDFVLVNFNLEASRGLSFCVTLVVSLVHSRSHEKFRKLGLVNIHDCGHVILGSNAWLMYRQLTERN